MKFRNIFSTLALIALFFISCDDTADNLGKEIQPTEDEIIVKADTFHLSSETFSIESIISRPDSFLIGEFEDKTLGITKAEVLGEFKLFEEGFTFLDDNIAITEADSVVMTLSFGSFFGNVNSPLHISIYELKDSLKRYNDYRSNIDPTPFVDYSKLIGDTAFTVKNGITGKFNTQVRFHMKDAFLRRFFTKNPLHYKNQEEFRKFFPGIFMTTDFGGATMLNLRDIKISLYYHYAYKTNLDEKLYGRKDFYVNPEVKKVNRIVHPYRALNISPNDEYNYISSPSNYYTRVRIPLDRIRSDVNVDNRILAVNSAAVKLNVKKLQVADESMIPYVNNMLLIKESALDRFFKNRESLSDTCSFLATRDSVYVSQNNYNYEFNFNGLANLIETEIKKKENISPYLDMVLVPVTPIFRQVSGSGNMAVSEIIQSNLLQSVSIYSGKHPAIPMKMEVIYSGF